MFSSKIRELISLFFAFYIGFSLNCRKGLGLSLPLLLEIPQFVNSKPRQETEEQVPKSDTEQVKNQEQTMDNPIQEKELESPNQRNGQENSTNQVDEQRIEDSNNDVKPQEQKETSENIETNNPEPKSDQDTKIGQEKEEVKSGEQEETKDAKQETKSSKQEETKLEDSEAKENSMNLSLKMTKSTTDVNSVSDTLSPSNDEEARETNEAQVVEAEDGSISKVNQ